MKTCEEIVSSLLERKKEYEAKKRRRSHTVAGILSAALVVAAGVWLLPRLTAKEPDSGAARPLPIPESVIWGETEETHGSSFLLWKGRMQVTGSLLQIMENNPGQTYAVRANYRRPAETIDDFFFEGKTPAEWVRLREELYIRHSLLTGLLKDGESLRYGEALLEPGNPSGDVWADDLYRSKVEEYGEEILKRYIQDGSFLREQLETDLAVLEADDGWTGWERATAAYLDEFLPDAAGSLPGQGIPFEIWERHLILFVTEEQLSSMKLDDLENWVFSPEPKDGEISTEGC